MTPARLQPIIHPPRRCIRRDGLAMRRTDLDIESLRSALSSSVVGCRVVYHESVGSTMDEAHSLAVSGAPEGSVVVAEEQREGRGRLGRSWISASGDDLHFSVLLRPSIAQLPYVNMAAGLAVSRAVGRVVGLRPTIKWPNDVRVGGMKLAGILIDTEIEAEAVRYAVVGVGLNVNLDTSRHPEIASTATSMFRETGSKQKRSGVLRRVLVELDDLYTAIRAGRSLRDEWAGMLDTLGRTIELRWADRVVRGRAESVDEQGNLVLVQPDGSSLTAPAGEVTLQV